LPVEAYLLAETCLPVEAYLPEEAYLPVEAYLIAETCYLYQSWGTLHKQDLLYSVMLPKMAMPLD
jgi:hypothetical protein